MNYNLSPRSNIAAVVPPSTKSSSCHPADDRIDRRQVVLIVGATAGPGLALTYHHASQGNDLVLVGRRKKPLDDLAAQLRYQQQNQIDVSTHAANLSSGPAAAKQLYETIVEKHKMKVDLMICNSDFCHYDTTTSRRILEDDTSALGPTLNTVLTLTSLFADDMATRGDGGTILNVGSASGILDDPTDANAVDQYVNLFSRNVKRDLRSRGVRARIQNHVLRRKRLGRHNSNGSLVRSLSKLFGGGDKNGSKQPNNNKQYVATKGNLRIRPSTRSPAAVAAASCQRRGR